MYYLYNITLRRPIKYHKKLTTIQQAKSALHHLQQRQKSCICLFNDDWSVLAIRVSKQSKHHFPRGFCANHYVSVPTDKLMVCSKETGEVLQQIPIKEL